ncbi:MAG TPA: hypothetical protein VKO20_08730, partial [Desulfosalsimonadaceae bacterium]|nr:hypothetical protein [Desulfosalsimonadaceae bacterium]
MTARLMDACGRGERTIMGLKSKFWVLTLAIVLALLLLLGYLLFNFWMQLPQEARVHIWQVTRDYFGLLFLIGLFVVMGFLFLLNEIFQNYILPLSRISEEIELISIVNPAHRISAEGGREIRRMVEQINKAADKLQFLQQQLRQKHQPDAGLSKDRQTLASLFTRLPLGVVVCNQRCKVLLYNKKAEELLCRCSSGSEETNECSLSLGLGRSLSAFLDPDQLSKAIQDLHGQMESHVEEPVAHLLVPQARGPDITAQMVCILDEADAILGYALFLHAQADYCLLDRPGSARMQNVPKPGFETKMQRINGLQSCRPCTYDFHLL